MSAAPSLAALPGPRASLARETLAWLDALWDGDRGLLWAPPGAALGDAHVPRESAWYAYGLLLRGGPGDAARAVRSLDALLALQYDEPGAPWHGTFARTAETPRPPEDAVVWVHYDPNWRQFLGTALLALLGDFEGRLPRPLVSRIDRALRLAVEGETPDRVPAAYSNIALMKAWLEVEAGRRLREPRFVAAGEGLADRVARGWSETRAFAEYNSPTYYGVDLYALALWRDRSASAVLRERGREIEAGLWRDLARWYHAGLRNLCAPYTRAYGMDMGRYVAALSLHVWAAFGRAAAPLPALTRDVEHGHDLGLGPLVAALGAEVPEDARDAFLRFPGEHAVRQPIDPAGGRVATGWLGADRMLGAERNGDVRLTGWSQYVAAALHWRRPDGGVGWLTVRAPGPSQARAAAHRLEIPWPAGARGELRVAVHAPGVRPDGFGADRWALPGLELRADCDLPSPDVEVGAEGATLTYRRLDSARAARLVLGLRGSRSPAAAPSRAPSWPRPRLRS